MSNRQKGFALAFFSAVLYGTVPILGKKFVNVFHPLFVAFALTLVTGCYFTITALWKKDLFRNFVFKKIKWIALIGFFATLGSIFSFFGLSFGRANEAGFFFQFETFFAGILAFLFLKERLSASQVKGLAVMFIGAYLFLTPFSFSLRIGNLFFLGSALVW
ncbi:MAG: DMT family transporter, partial [Candidatus Levybacteria bacterium]|nr:DMT family transporter [Candidatus Levybacteria bacterium]